MVRCSFAEDGSVVEVVLLDQVGLDWVGGREHVLKVEKESLFILEKNSLYFIKLAIFKVLKMF